MEIPKPHPPKPRSVIPEQSTSPSSTTESSSLSPELKSSETPSKPTAKREFVLKPHLTDKPLRNNEALVALRASMATPTTKRPRRK